MKFLLLLLYLLEIGFEAYVFYYVLSPDSKDRWRFDQVFLDILSVNLFTLVVVVVLLGRIIATLDFNMALASSLRTAMIFLPERIMKILLVTVALDAVGLAVYFRYKYPESDMFDIGFKGAIMNLPILLLTGLLWIFTAILNTFFNWIGLH